MKRQKKSDNEIDQLKEVLKTKEKEIEKLERLVETKDRVINKNRRGERLFSRRNYKMSKRERINCKTKRLLQESAWQI